MVCSTEKVLNHVNRNNVSLSVNKTTKHNETNKKLEIIKKSIENYNTKLEKLNSTSE